MKMKLCSIYIIVFFFLSCENKPKAEINFYYWKTQFKLNETENECLTFNKTNKIYTRFFDVGLENKVAVPIAIISFKNFKSNQNIVPVIYIKNEVFVQSDSLKNNEKTIYLMDLSKNIIKLVDALNLSIKNETSLLQIDCDWTDKTKTDYFYFLKLLQKNKKIEVTIRLHQIKYKEKTGIPPVENAVLMFYNIGHITANDDNSIYKKENAEKYISRLHEYHLNLKFALPIFSWGQQIRNGKVLALLNKVYTSDFETDMNFKQTKTNWFVAKKSCFKMGYYFQQNDKVKIENISEESLKEITKFVSDSYKKIIKEVIFYDLDSKNIQQYDKNIFQKTVSKLH